jgi:proton-translocating NADH-quinone oxidoreductase chain N
MMDLLTLSVVILSATSLALPLFQLTRMKILSAYILSAVLALVLVLIVYYGISPVENQISPSLLASDRLGSLFGAVAIGVSLFVTLASIQYMKTVNTAIYYSLIGFTSLGMLLLSFSKDLLMLFVSWELMSFPTYVLAGIDKKRRSNEAAVKYAVIGAMSSAIILYAISIAYGIAGSTEISQVVKAISSRHDLISASSILLFVAGFGFKMSIVPFHMWIPDAYEGAPTTVSTLFAAATKKSGFVVAIRVLLALTTAYVITNNTYFTIPNILAFLALITMTLGNIAALTQKSMTRLLAYSSIAQAGYILIGFVPFSVSPLSYDAQVGLTGSLFHIINHAIMKGSAFLVAALVILKLRRADVESYNGLSRRMPITSFTFAVSLLALAGIPPLNGFWSKVYIFLSVANGPYLWLAIAGVLNSAFSLGYYAWIVKRMYLDEPEKVESVNEPLLFIVIFAVLTGLIVGIGIFPQPFVNFASSAVSGLFF